MTTSTSNAEAIALKIQNELAACEATGRCPSPALSLDELRIILSYLASRREAQKPVEITWQDVRLQAGEGALSAVDVLAAVNAHLRMLHRYTAPPAPADDEAYDLGKLDGYEEAVQDIDIATGGDGEFKGSSILGGTVDVATMKARIIDRFRATAPPAPAGEVERLADPYLVWSNEHRCWWRADECGYTVHLGQAGRYTRDDALGICIGARGGRQYNENPSEVPIRLSDAERFWPDDRPEWQAVRAALNGGGSDG